MLNGIMIGDTKARDARSDLRETTDIYLRAPRAPRPLIEAYMDHLSDQLLEQPATGREP